MIEVVSGCSKCSVFNTSLVLSSSGLASFPGKLPPSDKKDTRHTQSSQRKKEGTSFLIALLWETGS